MALTLRWVGADEAARVGQVRAQCYGASAGMAEQYVQRLRSDTRAASGDFLLAERDGLAVGTTTSLSMQMWVRGGRIPCQGIAWVGTIKTHRRAGSAGERGIASQLMIESLRKARERQQVVTALMPFRASYYAHFGYGLVERRNEWTIPLSILPTGRFEGLRFMTPDDLPFVQDCRQRACERGQCDIERPPHAWAFPQSQWPNGFCVVDQPAPGGAVQSWMYFTEHKVDQKTHIRVIDASWDSIEAFRRQLYFLASLKDQYSAAVLMLPVDLPLNWLFSEPQIPHRPVEHAAAELRCETRMQLRILDHKRFLESLRLPPSAPRGKAVIAVRETEGTVSNFTVELEDGRFSVRPGGATPQIESIDTVWASVACGDLSASAAARAGLIQATDPAVLPLLDTLALGPTPFCNEYF